MKVFLFIILLLIPFFVFGQTTQKSTTSEHVFVVSDTVWMPQLNRTRRIWVYLPPDYNSDYKSYPVMYMHDGQNLFDNSTSFAGEWGVDETLDSLFSDGYDVPIVIGIDNGRELRIDELTPWPNSKYGGGDGDKYMRFIVETLKPEIDKRYRTLPDAAHTSIMGSSLGGLISFYGGLKYGSSINNIGVFSPSFWYSEKVYEFAQQIDTLPNTRIIILGSALEDSTMVPDMQKMVELLKTKMDTNNLKMIVTKDGQHSEWYWKREFPKSVVWLLDLKKE